MTNPFELDTPRAAGASGASRRDGMMRQQHHRIDGRRGRAGARPNCRLLPCSPPGFLRARDPPLLHPRPPSPPAATPVRAGAAAAPSRRPRTPATCMPPGRHAASTPRTLSLVDVGGSEAAACARQIGRRSHPPTAPMYAVPATRTPPRRGRGLADRRRRRPPPPPRGRSARRCAPRCAGPPACRRGRLHTVRQNISPQTFDTLARRRTQSLVPGPSF